MKKLTILALLTVLTACSTSQNVKWIGAGISDMVLKRFRFLLKSFNQLN